MDAKSDIICFLNTDARGEADKRNEESGGGGGCLKEEWG